MSKSYNNTIPLFTPAPQLRKLIMKIKTNSLEPGVPKETEGSTLFEIYRAFATPAQTAAYAARFAAGAGWGDLKQELFAWLDAHLSKPRGEYERLMADPGYVETALKAGAEQARGQATPFLRAIRQAVGIRPLR
jgi:tryptophanyl-tRNA synthetase